MERHRGDAGTKHEYSMSAIIRGKGNSHECGKNITTISLSQKTKGSLLALAWRELTTSREERLSLLRLSRGAKEEDESQLTTSREERLSLLRLSRNIVQTRAESSLLGYAECSRYSTKVNREGRRRKSNRTFKNAKVIHYFQSAKH